MVQKASEAVMKRASQGLEELSCNRVQSSSAKTYEEAAIEQLRASGLRVTGPRIQVVRALSKSNRALSAYQIHEKIRAARAKADVVSVYRVLRTLVELGLVHHIGVVDGYFACRKAGKHGAKTQHLVCRDCGCVLELSVPPASAAGFGAQAADAGFETEEIRIEVLGTCEHCRANSGSSG